jgi:hypothetical protein
MSINEQARHELYGRLEEILGPGPAATLMEHLPPSGWADVAMRRDLDLVEARLTATIERRVTDAVRMHVFTSVASVMGAVSLAFAAARF